MLFPFQWLKSIFLLSFQEALYFFTELKRRFLDFEGLPFKKFTGGTDIYSGNIRIKIKKCKIAQQQCCKKFLMKLLRIRRGYFVFALFIRSIFYCVYIQTVTQVIFKNKRIHFSQSLFGTDVRHTGGNLSATNFLYNYSLQINYDL